MRRVLEPAGTVILKLPSSPTVVPTLLCSLTMIEAPMAASLSGGGDDGARHHLLRERRQEPQEQGEEE